MPPEGTICRFQSLATPPAPKVKVCSILKARAKSPAMQVVMVGQVSPENFERRKDVAWENLCRENG
jgi:hypothetical protein